MGLRTATTVVSGTETTNFITVNAINAMAPALTEPLDQNKPEITASPRAASTSSPTPHLHRTPQTLIVASSLPTVSTTIGKSPVLSSDKSQYNYSKSVQNTNSKSAFQQAFIDQTFSNGLKIQNSFRKVTHMDRSNNSLDDTSVQEIKNNNRNNNIFATTASADTTGGKKALNKPITLPLASNVEAIAPNHSSIVTENSQEIDYIVEEEDIVNQSLSEGNERKSIFHIIEGEAPSQIQLVTSTNSSSRPSVSNPSVGSAGIACPITNSQNMGLLKDSAEMDQMLGDLTTTGDIDLMQLQVFCKNLESGPNDNLSELASGLALFNDVDVINMALDDVTGTTPVSGNKNTVDAQALREDIDSKQRQMIRKLDFLTRRLRKIQARCMGQHINEEVNGIFVYTQQLVKRKERESKTISTMTPVAELNSEKWKNNTTNSIKNMVNQINFVASNQQYSVKKPTIVGQQTILKSNTGPSSASGHVKITAIPVTKLVPTFDSDSVKQISQSTGLLQCELKMVQHSIDSDATASSSGSESADELIGLNNQTKSKLPTAKQAAWRWARDRAGIASRWTWLQAQISDLDYRIRQHSELHAQIKQNKGPLLFEQPLNQEIAGANISGTFDQSSAGGSSVPSQQSVNGYRGILPGNSKLTDSGIVPNELYENDNGSSCRTRAFQSGAGFRKRKLLQTTNLHTISKKAARPSNIKCGCQWPLHPCALCTGRQDPTAPRELPDMLSKQERVALLDPCFHPVINFPEDISHNLHVEALISQADWQSKTYRISPKAVIKGAMAMQKAMEREEMASKHSSHATAGANSGDGSGKFSKYNMVAKKIKKAKNRRDVPRYTHLVKHKIKKKRGMSNVRDTEFSHLRDSFDADVDGKVLRSKNTSPTHGSHHKPERQISHSARKNKNSYDIDNIVIPYSMAASAQIEVLKYKEIPTPNWKVVEEEDDVKAPSQRNKLQTLNIANISKGEIMPATIPGKLNQINSNQTTASLESTDVEDVTLETVIIRHEQALAEERKKFSTFLKFPWSTRSRANRRVDSRNDSSGTNTPDPTSPAPSTSIIGIDQESISSHASIALPSTSVLTIENSSTMAANTDTTANSTNVLANVFLNSASTPKSERRRTMSVKKYADVKEVTATPLEIKEATPPFEPLIFPLPDDLFHDLLQQSASRSYIDDDFLPLSSVQKMNESAFLDKTDSLDQMISMDLNESNLIEIAVSDNHLDDYVYDDMGSDTESAISGIPDDEDPNDPEWCEPEDQ